MSSFNRKLADLINDQGDLKSSKVVSFDSSEVTTIITSNVTGTAAYYGSLDSLPTTGLTEGQKALVKISDSIGRLYITDGSGWYNANTNLNTAGPTWVTEPDVSYTISDSVTPLTITALATDVDSDVLVDTSFAADSAQYLVTISRDSSVWTFTPKSADSIGESVAAGNLEDSSGEFTYTFRWNDGVNVVSKQVTISYSTAIPSAASLLGFGTRGFVAGYYRYSGGDDTDRIDYFDTSNGATVTSFGSLPGDDRVQGMGVSDRTRAVFIGGRKWNIGSTGSNSMDYITCATLGNSTSFGSGVNDHSRGGASSISDGTRGVWHRGGYYTSEQISPSPLHYITIQTTGGAQSFGNLRSEKASHTLATCNNTYGIIGSGYINANSDQTNDMYQITIATTGNATIHGDGPTGYNSGGFSNGTNAIMADGNTYFVMNFETSGNATQGPSSYWPDGSHSNGSIMYWNSTYGRGINTGNTSPTNSVESINTETYATATLSFSGTRWNGGIAWGACATGNAA